MRILGICFISLGWFSCKDEPKFDNPGESAQVKDLRPQDQIDSEDAEAAQQALEPVPIGGAYLTCRYEVVESNGEVWCRLEENDQPVLVETLPTLENWVFTQNDVPYDAAPFALDPATGWQWAIKIPKDNQVEVALDIFLDGVRYHFSTTISTLPPSEVEETSDTPATLQDKRYAYGNTASFVVDTNPFSFAAPQSCQQPEGENAKPDPTLPNLRLFLKAQKFTFPFKVTADSLLTVTVDEICGQMRPIHYAELRGVGVNFQAPIPVGAKKVSVIKGTTLPPGDYEVVVHYVPRSVADLLNQESFAFGKLVLESSADLVPGRAYRNDEKPAE
ncbi:hypothetical protein [Oligoflexus tunisiensis]|uniref:hypothetical protein n=1 Tax=Oligoflexus tunisiensis TaxID=708132 RepID=UPI001C407D46|nr:hypothetical protein [Oligoflexus tunisiensis]